MRNCGIQINNSSFIIKEFDFSPEIKKWFSLIEILYCWICWSDFHRINDNNFSQQNYLWHEIVGKVINSHKSNLIWQYVVINPLLPCNNCEFCFDGLNNLCDNIKGIWRNIDGWFLKYIIVDNNNIYPLNIKNSEIYLWVFVDSIAVVLHSIKLLWDISNLDNFLVIWAGNIWLISAFILQKKYNKKVKILYNNKKKYFDKFNEFEFVSRKDLECNNNYFDVSLETVGGRQSETINICIDKTKKWGNILVFGVFAENYFWEINLRNLFYKEITLKGSNSFVTNNNYDDFKEAIDFLYKNEKFFKLLVNNIFYFKNISLELVNNKENSVKNIFTYLL